MVLAAVSAMLVVSTAACSQPVNIESGVATQEYPVEINGLTIQSKPQKVTVLSGSLADIVLAIGYETSLSQASEDCTQPDLQVLPKISATDANVIISNGSDLVLAENDISSEMRSALEEAGISVLVLDRATNRESFERLYSQVGSALNGASSGYNAGIRAAQQIFSSLDDLARMAPESTTVVTACFISDLDNTLAVTGDELGSVLLSYMGLTNIFQGNSGGVFTMEDFQLGDPTMIFCTEEVAQQLLSDPEYSDFTAVQTERIYPIDPHYMTWQGRTVFTGSIEMMGLAYPELTETSSASVTVELGTPTPEPTATPEPTPTPEPDATPPPLPDPSQYKALEFGDTSDAIKTMQDRLAALGYLTEEYNGYFGAVTEEAIKAFQKANNLEADGAATPETLALLFSEYAIDVYGHANAQLPAATATPEPIADGDPGDGFNTNIDNGASAVADPSGDGVTAHQDS